MNTELLKLNIEPGQNPQEALEKYCQDHKEEIAVHCKVIQKLINVKFNIVLKRVSPTNMSVWVFEELKKIPLQYPNELYNVGHDFAKDFEIVDKSDRHFEDFIIEKIVELKLKEHEIDQKEKRDKEAEKMRQRTIELYFR